VFYCSPKFCVLATIFFFIETLISTDPWVPHLVAGGGGGLAPGFPFTTPSTPNLQWRLVGHPQCSSRHFVGRAFRLSRMFVAFAGRPGGAIGSCSSCKCFRSPALGNRICPNCWILLNITRQQTGKSATLHRERRGKSRAFLYVDKTVWRMVLLRVIHRFLLLQFTQSGLVDNQQVLGPAIRVANFLFVFFLVRKSELNWSLAIEKDGRRHIGWCLGGRNYESWKFGMKLALQSDELWGIVDGTEQKPDVVRNSYYSLLCFLLVLCWWKLVASEAMRLCCQYFFFPLLWSEWTSTRQLSVFPYRDDMRGIPHYDNVRPSMDIRKKS
jgi:hypothetical protein